MATTEDSPPNDETTVKKEFASFVAVSDGNETKFDIFKAGFISGRNASTMEQPKDVASGWSDREEVVQSVLLQCAENGIPVTRHAVRLILEQISQNREALDFLARH